MVTSSNPFARTRRPLITSTCPRSIGGICSSPSPLPLPNNGKPVGVVLDLLVEIRGATELLETLLQDERPAPAPAAGPR